METDQEEDKRFTHKECLNLNKFFKEANKKRQHYRMICECEVDELGECNYCDYIIEFITDSWGRYHCSLGGFKVEYSHSSCNEYVKNNREFLPEPKKPSVLHVCFKKLSNFRLTRLLARKVKDQKSE